jgi:hypothetical protein
MQIDHRSPSRIAHRLPIQDVTIGNLEKAGLVRLYRGMPLNHEPSLTPLIARTRHQVAMPTASTPNTANSRFSRG